MAKVAILPIPTKHGGIFYHAIAGDKQSQGKTAGEALDALTAQLPEDESGTLVIVQNLRPDQYFNSAQQKRLAELMDRWREARDTGQELSATDQIELSALVEAELKATAARTAALADELGR